MKLTKVSYQIPDVSKRKLEWILWLVCGHIVRKPMEYSNETDELKPAPKKVRCPYCGG